MTPDERTLLTRYLRDLVATRNPVKDAEAATLIGQALEANPDAFYLLVQHAIIADHSLQLAQERIEALEGELAARQPSANPGAGQGSFLGGATSNPFATAATAPSAASGGPWGRPADAQPPAPAYAAPSAFPPVQSQPSGFSSFLRNVGTTAMGVVAGQALFSGVEGLFGGHSAGIGSGLFGNGLAGAEQNALGGLNGGFGGAGETVIVNNFGDTGSDSLTDAGWDTAADDDSDYDTGGDSDTFA